MAKPINTLDMEIREFLELNSTATLCSTYNNEPWAAAVFYVSENCDFYFYSSPQSRHMEQLKQNSRAAAAIHGDYWRWEEIRGLQMEGRVTWVNELKLKTRIAALYLKKFPLVESFFKNPLSVSASAAGKMSRVELYAFNSERIYFMDNSQGFGERKCHIVK